MMGHMFIKFLPANDWLGTIQKLEELIQKGSIWWLQGQRGLKRLQMHCGERVDKTCLQVRLEE